MNAHTFNTVGNVDMYKSTYEQKQIVFHTEYCLLDTLMESMETGKIDDVRDENNYIWFLNKRFH
ncbi:CLUMA_CG013884, isoform A [Clunio marinus]|uniref:CLUMA_CG013884, isoform A n=1 Tax=Clunio marinus TaxID=568069 RepID=A0A1J1IKC0_9DIPT|nr:CLUMA_CG013884, isoform A [Clunio marinus]